MRRGDARGDTGVVFQERQIGLEARAFAGGCHAAEKEGRDVLAAHAGSVSRFGMAHRFLAELLARTDYLTPAELYGHVLVTLDGRRKLLARLGMEADDPIDEFMNLVLAYERSHAPSLQGFLHWVDAGDAEIFDHIAQAYLKLGDKPKALDYLKRASTLNPEDAKIRQRLEEVSH